jgi:hypothetical protein
LKVAFIASSIKSSVMPLMFRFISGDILRVFLLGIVNAYCLTPSITNSLGITSLDDGPIQPSLAYKYPEYFQTDVNAVRYLLLMWTSSTKWIPAVAFKYFSIDAIYFHIFFTYMQTVLLLIGTFMLSRALTQSRSISYVSIFFVIIYSPYFNNFAWYGDQFFMPYPTWCSIGPLMISWSYAIMANNKLYIFWLIIGCSIHPVMGICGSILILTSILYKKNLNDRDGLVKPFILGFSPPLFFAVISWAIGYFNASNTPPSDWKNSTKEVAHWYAWQWNPNTDEAFFEQSTYSIILIFSALFLLYSFLNQNLSILNIIVKRSVIIFVIFYATQALSYTLNVRELYSLSLGRVSIFTSLIAAIVFAKFFIEAVQNTSNAYSENLRIMVIITILVPSFFNLFALSLVLLVFEFKKHGSKYIRVTYYCLYSLSILFFLFASFSKSWFRIPAKPELLDSFFVVPNFFLIKVAKYFLNDETWLVYIILVALFAILLHYFYGSHKFTIINGILIGLLVLLTIGTFYSRYTQSINRDYERKEWIETQIWARDQTAFGSRFILDTKLDLYSSWTTLSQRPRITSSSGGFIYTYTKDDEFFDNLAKTFGPKPGSMATSKEIEKYYLTVSNRLGGEYIVQNISDTQLSWQKVYVNTKFVIYKIPNS